MRGLTLVAPEAPETSDVLFGRVKRIHLIGIGGTGMSGIAEILLNLGFEVSGSDLAATETTERLERLGATIARGHGSALAERADVAVVTSAVSADNPEVALARAAGVPVIPRAEMLAELMRAKRGVAVGGAHGKTTTTWMTGLVLARAELDPTVVVGGRLKQLGTNARLGEGDLLVAEADESDGTFLMLAPELAVVTNIDREHLDYYKDLDSIKEAFVRFCNRVPFYGAAVVNADDPELRAILPRVTRRTVTFGVEPGADVRAGGIRRHGQESRFAVFSGDRELGDARLFIPGLHNVRNALAAIAVGLELEIPFPVVAAGLEDFRGIHRRMELKGEHRGRLVMDDYGHHPTEVRATLAALRAAYPDRRLVVVFQPHRFSRTERLAEEFGAVFGDAQRLFLLDVYPAGEEPIPGVDSGRIAEAVERAGGPEPLWIRDRREAARRIASESLAGDLILTLGAGDVWRTGEEVFLALTRMGGGGGGIFL